MKIGVDFGGTNIRVGLVDQGVVIKSKTVLTKGNRAELEILTDLIETISNNMTENVSSIGVGVPSVVDVDQGIVYDVANIPSWRKVCLKDILEKEFKIPVAVNNDCNCFILGELLYGEGIGYQDIVGITLGTGVGAGIIIRGELYNGANTGAGEIGELPYLDHNYEYYCSSHFFEKEYKSTGKEIYQKAVKGEQEALDILSTFGNHIGSLLKVALLAYDPQMIILGGSISQSFPYFSESMYNSLNDFPYHQTISKIKIKCSTKQDIGLLGASELI